MMLLICTHLGKRKVLFEYLYYGVLMMYELVWLGAVVITSFNLHMVSSTGGAYLNKELIASTFFHGRPYNCPPPFLIRKVAHNVFFHNCKGINLYNNRNFIVSPKESWGVHFKKLEKFL